MHVRSLALVVLLVLSVASCSAGTGRDPVTSGASTSVAYVEPPASERDGERYESQSSASTPSGAAWEFENGLRVELTAATRLDGDLGARSRIDAGLALVRIDFSYTNNGPVLNLSEGRQLPVRLLYGDGQEAAGVDGGFVGSDELTVLVPAEVPSGATVHGARSFAVPVGETDTLSVLVVEPRRFTEHLFTDVQVLLDRGPG